MRLPFFYGWLVVAIVFVTMGIGVNARTAFSLLFPPLIEEFGWPLALFGGPLRVGPGKGGSGVEAEGSSTCRPRPDRPS